ncbi:MAG: DUF3179 domain-containing protein [Gammaproteobacteria bacterium]|nr:DUF3179 domain-containing protein [Gammaproteobacteria bacterium]
MNPLITTLFALALLPVQAASGQTLNGFDLSNASVPVEEILSGGPLRDGIPAIDRPRFVAAREAGFLKDDDRVLGLVLSGIARAYPIRILNWHEIVNDRFDGEAVVISFCPLCGTGTAFRPGQGKAKTFGVSGLLYNSDLLLYDRETESLWSQILAKAVSGTLHGERLQLLPLEHTTWRDWRERYPGTLVLSTDTGHRRDYNRSPYAGYETSGGLYFPVTRIDPRYHPKEQVIGIEIGGRFKAYPFGELARTTGEVIDEINGTKVIIRFDKTHRSAQAFDADNKMIPGITGFWFAWMAFHPDSEVFIAE